VALFIYHRIEEFLLEVESERDRAHNEDMKIMARLKRYSYGRLYTR